MTLPSPSAEPADQVAVAAGLDVDAHRVGDGGRARRVRADEVALHDVVVAQQLDAHSSPETRLALTTFPDASTEHADRRPERGGAGGVRADPVAEDLVPRAALEPHLGHCRGSR